MGVVGAVGGYAVYRPLARVLGGLRGQLGAAAFAAWCATVLAALAAAAELALSGVVAWRVVLPAMAGVHMLIGLGEAVITALVLVAVARARPDLVGDPAPVPPRRRNWLVPVGLAVTLALAALAAPLASELPDGLEWVAARLGFLERAAPSPLVPAPLPDYAVPGIAPATLATLLAGLAGTVVVFGLALGLARLLVPEATAGRARR
jgi:cobalt/nickel transport system permease protein